MPDERSYPSAEKAKGPQPVGNFTVAGRVQLEKGEEAPRELQLKAYVFDPGGRFLGTGDVDAQGKFKTEVSLTQPSPVEIVVAPAGEPEAIRRSSAPRYRFGAKDWAAEGRRFLLKPDLHLRPDILQLFYPLWICVSGHVRKVFTRNGENEVCPVPRVKVEIFDVDREGCWWPYIIRQLDRVSDRPVLRAADLLKASAATPRAAEASRETFRAEAAGFAEAAADVSQARVGEVKSLAPGVTSRLDQLTLTSIIAPWIYFPRCFYSRELVCETYTDCDGYFSCCFPWWIFHLRRGRLRFDTRPDIIIRVTQVINGVETVIYMDPYTSTRWNVTNAHIDLFLDNEAIVCGSSACDPLPGTSRAALLQIGSDPVWLADQSDHGKFKTPPYSNGAFGGSLHLRGNFTADLLTGSPKRYYKLSWAPEGSSDFTPIQTTLSALRSAIGGTFDTYVLGPQPTGSPLAGLYEVQDFNHWWLMPGAPGGSGMVLGVWDTSFEADQGAYVVRMEVYDEAGNKITTMQFDRHAGDGTGVDHVTPVTDHLDLGFYIDNKPVEFNLTTPATNDCGVIPWSPTLNLLVHVHAEQENGRVNSWDLDYVRGVTTTRLDLGAGNFNAGQGVVDVDVDANGLLTGLTTTCAFALMLRAWAHVRGDWGWAYYGEKIYAIAIEKCPPCPSPEG
jgi:hypothetical protein